MVTKNKVSFVYFRLLKLLSLKILLFNNYSLFHNFIVCLIYYFVIFIDV